MSFIIAGSIDSNPDNRETTENMSPIENSIEMSLQQNNLENGDSRKRHFQISTPSPCFRIPSTPFLSNSDFINRFETSANPFYVACGALNAADLNEFIFDQNGSMIGAL